MLYIGLDAHQTTSSFCILNENGSRVKRQTRAIASKSLG